MIDMDGNDENVPYENMSPREKVRVRQILNICDNAMVSDEAYHELAQHVPEMPQKYNVVACRNELDSKIEMNRTPGLLPGSFVSLESELLKFIQGCCESNTPLPDKLKIKISGDGAKASRISNFIVISFSMVFDENFSQSHLNQNVLAIVNCDETIQILRKALVLYWQK